MTIEIVLEWLIKIAVLTFILLTAVAYLSYLERRVAGFIQLRVGPNRVGPLGLLQPAADGLKFILKEDIIPLHVNKVLYMLAPAIALVPALMSMIVIPYGTTVNLFGREIAFYVTSMDIGILYLLGIASLGVYGIALAGWSSNNKFSLMGGLRSSAQMISYELALGLSIVAVVLWSGSLDLVEIVESQRGTWFGFLPRWNIFLLPIGFIIFYIASLAETNRVPFDLPEAEAELVAGYHTEYSAMKFAMFFMAEYINLVTAASLSTTLFFGGYLGPGIDTYPWLGVVYFTLKVAFFIFVYMWIRWTVPRFRYDQLMKFGWKVMLPAAIINVAVTATIIILAVK